MIGGPAQQHRPLVTVQEATELLTGMVPVDQEHQTRPEVVEIGEKVRAILGRERAGREKERLAACKARDLVGARRGPDNGERLEQPAEKAQPLEMHVAVGQGDEQALDVDDDHAGVGRADIVLD